MSFTPSTLIYAKRITGKGLGVFAAVDIDKEQEIERVPLIVMPLREAQQIHGGGVLGHYAFTWSDTQVAVALGYGSLYNHSVTPNAYYVDRSPRAKVFIARKRIRAGEEITINYNGDPTSRANVDFPLK